MLAFALAFSDIDECSAESSPCDENADCTNSDGSYTCTCKQGFAGNGTICEGALGSDCYEVNLYLHSHGICSFFLSFFLSFFFSFFSQLLIHLATSSP